MNGMPIYSPFLSGFVHRLTRRTLFLENSFSGSSTLSILYPVQQWLYAAGRPCQSQPATSTTLNGYPNSEEHVRSDHNDVARLLVPAVRPDLAALPRWLLFPKSPMLRHAAFHPSWVTPIHKE